MAVLWRPLIFARASSFLCIKMHLEISRPSSFAQPNQMLDVEISQWLAFATSTPLEHHFTGLATLFVFHAMIRIVATGNGLSGRQIDLIVWTAVSVGCAAAWFYTFRSLLPFSHPPWQRLLDKIVYIPLYFDVLYVMVAYFACSAFLLGTADWRWLLMHVWMYGAMAAVAVISITNKPSLFFGMSPQPSVLIRLFLLALRYQFWLAGYNVFYTQCALLSDTRRTHTWARYWHNICWIASQLCSVYLVWWCYDLQQLGYAVCFPSAK